VGERPRHSRAVDLSGGGMRPASGRPGRRGPGATDAGGAGTGAEARPAYPFRGGSLGRISTRL